jgi:nucleotide-binding universal stress UspA family protein
VIRITAAVHVATENRFMAEETTMKILLAIDDSRGSNAALRAVAEQAFLDHSEVKILTVVEPSSAPMRFAVAAAGQMAGYPASLSSEEQAESQRARELIDEAVDELQRAGVQAAGTVELGNPKTVIVDTAAQWDADLIVVGAHGRTALERFLIGSVSEGVARHAPCSVEIVRSPTKH